MQKIFRAAANREKGTLMHIGTCIGLRESNFKIDFSGHRSVGLLTKGKEAKKEHTQYTIFLDNLPDLSTSQGTGVQQT
jgi:hypothetical protein